MLTPLLSNHRFLKNLLPYTDNSSGKSVEKYYIERLDQDADDATEQLLRRKGTILNVVRIVKS